MAPTKLPKREGLKLQMSFTNSSYYSCFFFSFFFPFKYNFFHLGLRISAEGTVTLLRTQFVNWATWGWKKIQHFPSASVHKPQPYKCKNYLFSILITASSLRGTEGWEAGHKWEKILQGINMFRKIQKAAAPSLFKGENLVIGAAETFFSQSILWCRDFNKGCTAAAVSEHNTKPSSERPDLLISTNHCKHNVLFCAYHPHRPKAPSPILLQRILAEAGTDRHGSAPGSWVRTLSLGAWLCSGLPPGKRPLAVLAAELVGVSLRVSRWPASAWHAGLSHRGTPGCALHAVCWAPRTGSRATAAGCTALIALIALLHRAGP